MFRITRIYGKNTETRDAYYQLIRVQDVKTGRGAVALNYGPRDGGVEWPITNGVTKIKTGTNRRLVSDIWNDSLAAKRKTGYKFDAEELITEDKFGPIEGALKAIFKRTDVDKIIKGILPDDTSADDEDEAGNGAEPDSLEADSYFSAQEPEHEEEPAPKPQTPKHEAWGTW